MGTQPDNSGMAKTKTAEVAVRRPMPPTNLGQFHDGSNWPVSFAPAPDLRKWMLDTFVEEGGALHNPDHAHLADVDFDVLWAAGPFEKQGRLVLGQTEMVSFRSGGWQKIRQEEQMALWFGRVPEFLITLAGSFALEASDVEFCALVEHELYHIGHVKDDFGAPAFGRDGKAKIAMRGHDVEEFVGVVARYGVGDPGGGLARLVRAGNANPEVSGIRVRQACGTCLLRLA
jgi:hypothetical protein